MEVDLPFDLRMTVYFMRNGEKTSVVKSKEPYTCLKYSYRGPIKQRNPVLSKVPKTSYDLIYLTSSSQGIVSLLNIVSPLKYSSLVLSFCSMVTRQNYIVDFTELNLNPPSGTFSLLGLLKKRTSIIPHLQIIFTMSPDHQ